MLKKFLYILLVLVVLTNVCSCAPFQNKIDHRTGFSGYLIETEDSIRSENWDRAKSGLEDSKKTWKRIKPFLQIDIDHDYINRIEEEFVKLEGYIETKEKADSLAIILLIRNTWEKIGSL